MATNFRSIPISVRIAQIYLFLLSLMLALFSVLTLSYGTPPIIAGLMMLDAILLVLTGWAITHRSPTTFWLTVILVAGNILMIIMDQVGLIDIIILIVFFGLLLWLLVVIRKFNSPH